MGSPQYFRDKRESIRQFGHDRHELIWRQELHPRLQLFRVLLPDEVDVVNASEEGGRALIALFFCCAIRPLHLDICLPHAELPAYELLAVARRGHMRYVEVESGVVKPEWLTDGADVGLFQR